MTMAAGKIETAFAVVIQLGIAVALWFAAWWCWPGGIGDIPLGSLTLNQLGRIAGAVLLALFGVGFMLKAAYDPNA